MREYDRDRERVPREEEDQPAPRSSGERRGRKKKKKNPVVRHIFRAVASLICLGIIAGCILACYLTVYAFDMLEDDQYILDLDAKRLEYTTFMYAQDPETEEWVELQRLSSENGNRIWVDYDQLPDTLLDTIVAVEDKRFWEHNGVDWVTTIKATVNLIGHKFHVPFLTFYEGTPGASTITQQVTRNITEDKEVDVMRKAREIVRALKLERRYSKDQIIETYLNLVSFGNNTYGIQAAANLYFDKDVSQLTVAECASIVGITKDPTYYNPFYNTEKNSGLENNLKRKDDILFLMHEQGKLTDEEYETELNRELVFASENKEKMVNYDQSYFVDYAIECVINDLAAQNGCTYREAEAMLLSGGYRIYTTVDTRVQDILDEVYETYEFPTVKNEEKPQSAFVITEPNGRIVALRGGTGVKEGARIWNRATDTTRQAGSTIKPITSYALAIQQNLVNFSTLIEDKQVVVKQDEGQPDWKPGNFYGNFKGFMTVSEAIQRSCNMVPVQLVQMLTPRACWNFLHDTLNIQSLSEMDIAYSPMALGSLTNGITPLDMAGAYQMYANGGMRTQPYCYTRVLDSRGKVVLENRQAPQRVMDYDSATVMNKLLQRVVNAAPGTGTDANLGAMNIPVAGKTGTTDDDVDQWFVGLTPYYVGVCWVGYDDQFQRDEEGNLLYDGYGRKIPNSVRYSRYPPPLLWKEVMSRVHEGLESKDFAGSSSVIALKYCTLTGYAATPDCEYAITGWYKNENIPSACPYHTGMNPDVPLVGQKSPDPDDMFPEDDYDPDDDDD
ncbi:MAG: hypothetical protein HFF10_09045 [Angelakisella sp.]|nr:hypothetical protein [Angelakisella sp.]